MTSKKYFQSVNQKVLDKFYLSIIMGYMDSELKGLLLKVIEKMEAQEKRIQKLEAESHKQITLEDYYNTYKRYLYDPYNGQTTALPLDYRYIPIC